MSKEELLSWTSMSISVSVIILYPLLMFGWPDILPDYSSRFVKIFVNIFWIALAIELIIGLNENKSKVEKDERDRKIESYGYKYAYSFLAGAVILLLANVFLGMLFGNVSDVHAYMADSKFIFHTLFLTLCMSSAIRRGTMIYHYRKNS